MSRRATHRSKTRLSLDLADETMERLDSLLERSSSDSKAEVIRRALGIFDLLLTNRLEGGTTILKKRDGEAVEVVFL